LLVPSIVLPGAAVLALLRYAVDLLVPFSLLILIPRSIRDTLADWLAGELYADEPDPVWAAAVVSISLFGMAAGVLWLLSTSQWAAATAVQAWLPARVLDLTQAAERQGWGQRVLLPGGPGRRAPGLVSAPPQADPIQTRTSTVVEQDPAPIGRELPDDAAASTGPVAEPSASPATTATPTTTILTSSATRVRAGYDGLRLTARVTAHESGVTGSVTFWDRGSMLGSATLDRTGRAELSVTALPRGRHLLTARYAAHGGYAASRSLPIVIVVRP
jgi:hypothetical protein